MKTKKVKLISLLFICFTIFEIADNHRIYGSNSQRIALLPFKINAADDLSFLRDGIDLAPSWKSRQMSGLHTGFYRWRFRQRRPR